MRIVIFSDKKNVVQIFARIEKNKNYQVEFVSLADMKKNIKQLGRGDLAYVDTGTMDQATITRTMGFLKKQNNCIFAIIDPRGQIKDVSSVFHSGGVDYIGREETRQGIDLKRIKRVFSFVDERYGAFDEDAERAPSVTCIPSGTDWKHIQSGREYTFTLMYFELDNQPQLKKLFGSQNIEKVIREFHDYLQAQVARYQGKIWMWMDFGGLILFPFDGKHCDSIKLAFSMILNRRLISIEDFNYDMLLSFRIAMHLGTTLYQARGKTGDIISDSINSVFHLGQKFAEPGGLYLTSDIQPFLPRGLEKSFLSAGNYEGREIFRMRQLI